MKKLLLGAILFQCTAAFGQEAIGLFEDNYTGSTAMLINPAAPFSDPNTWEINIVSAGVFLDNNFVYYTNQTAFSLVNYIQSDEHNGENISFFNQSTVIVNAAGFAQGPSAYFHINNFTVGLFTDIRVGASIESSQSPQNLNNLFTVPYNQLIKIPELHSAYMNWAEIGVNGAVLLKDYDNSKLCIGADIKLLGGLTAMKFASNKPFELERRGDSTVNTSPVNITYAYAQSASGGSPISNLLGFNGFGVGMDIGILWIIGEQVSCNQLYNWKLGASINDIGSITYESRTSDYKVTSPNENGFPDSAFVHTTTISDLNQALSGIVYGDTTISHAGTGFTIWLPMSFTVLVDKSLGSGFYIAASAIHHIPVTFNMIYAPNIESLTPRYESKWLTVSIPLLLYNQTDFHFGISIRFGPLTVGTDDLGSLILPGEMAGADAYLGLRISPFKSNCKKPKAVKNSDKYKECPPQPKD